ncbi:PLAT/LH2 domain-containing protein [Rubritalea profundi]|uniref:PLAT domain-containing protein n=1 Tax=Rubritalea profundi TaxID=1658618 RepID=A0A2S7U5J2_9BACT|nr:PLAT/LH2 domain-containing protein [Rubritalea profundi]PQJ29840.1 hypothetical protein BSZ32_16030 [Rubritalea profundi]
MSKIDYKIRVRTGDISGGDTDGNVYITLYGHADQAAETELDMENHDDFESGNADTYCIKATDVGRVVKINVRCKGGSWWLEFVEVSKGNEPAVKFIHNNWLGKKKDEEDVFLFASTPKFTTANPVEFDFYNKDDERVLFITDDESQLKKQTLILELKNTSPREIEFQTPDTDPKPKNPEGAKLKWTDWKAGKDLYHFQLSFRPGVLSEKTKACLKDPAYRLATLAKGWDMQYDPDATDFTDWISLLWVGENRGKNFAEALKVDPGAEPPKTPGAAAGIPKQARLHLELLKLSAGAGGGARGTRIHLNYRHLVYKDKEPKEVIPEGTRNQFLNIVNHQGKQYIPLHVGFVGSNTVLNDGETANELNLRITNTSNSETIMFTKNSASRFSISFDLEKDHEKKEWALTKIGEAVGIQIQWGAGDNAGRTKLSESHVDRVGQIEPGPKIQIAGRLEKLLPENSSLMFVRRDGERTLRSSIAVVSATAAAGTDWIYLKEPTSAKPDDSIELLKHEVTRENPQWKPELSLQGERLSWHFTYTGDADYGLGPGESITLKLSELKSSSPTGYANLYLHYEDIPGYWDGHYTCLIEKTPLVYRQGKVGHGDVGIGTDMEPVNYNDKPTPKLHVDVTKDNDGPHVPKPAAVFEGGNVGIGTVAPETRLHIHGGPLQVSHSTDSAVVELKNDKHTNYLFTDGITGHAHLRTDSTQHHVALQTGGGSQGNVGIGTPLPKSKLAVTKGLTVGKTYAEAHPAPTNGLLVEGNVGIGTGATAPTHALHIAGKDAALRLSGTKGKWSYNAKLNFGDSEHVYLHEDKDDHLTIHSKEGLALTGGPVTLGTNLFALAGVQNLRVIVGSIKENGDLEWGDGLNKTNTRTANGRYKITFIEEFKGTPSVVVTQVGILDEKDDNCITVLPSKTNFTVSIADVSGDAKHHEDTSFNFIAIGPR